MGDEARRWLDRLAAPGPDPGGGAAAAVMLALGSALTQMVASYPARPGATVDLDQVVASSVALRERSLALVAVDAAASARLIAAWHAGGHDLRDAALAAARSSADIVDVAAEAEPLLDLLLTGGSRNVLADVAVAAVSYAAAVRAATINLVGDLRIAADGSGSIEDAEPLAGPMMSSVAEADALADRLDALGLRIREM